MTFVSKKEFEELKKQVYQQEIVITNLIEEVGKLKEQNKQPAYFG